MEENFNSLTDILDCAPVTAMKFVMAVATSGLLKTIDSLAYIRTCISLCSLLFFCIGTITLYAT